MLKSLLVTILIMAGPLLLWAAFRLYPEWFQGRLRIVQWIVAALIGFMLLVASTDLYLDKKHARPGAEKTSYITTICRSL